MVAGEVHPEAPPPVCTARLWRLQAAEAGPSQCAPSFQQLSAPRLQLDGVLAPSGASLAVSPCGRRLAVVMVTGRLLADTSGTTGVAATASDAASGGSSNAGALQAGNDSSMQPSAPSAIELAPGVDSATSSSSNSFLTVPPAAILALPPPPASYAHGESPLVAEGYAAPEQPARHGAGSGATTGPAAGSGATSSGPAGDAAYTFAATAAALGRVAGATSSMLPPLLLDTSETESYSSYSSYSSSADDEEVHPGLVTDDNEDSLPPLSSDDNPMDGMPGLDSSSSGDDDGGDGWGGAPWRAGAGGDGAATAHDLGGLRRLIDSLDAGLQRQLDAANGAATALAAQRASLRAGNDHVHSLLDALDARLGARLAVDVHRLAPVARPGGTALRQLLAAVGDVGAGQRPPMLPARSDRSGMVSDQPCELRVYSLEVWTATFGFCLRLWHPSPVRSWPPCLHDIHSFTDLCTHATRVVRFNRNSVLNACNYVLNQSYHADIPPSTTSKASKTWRPCLPPRPASQRLPRPQPNPIR